MTCIEGHKSSQGYQTSKRYSQVTQAFRKKETGQRCPVSARTLSEMGIMMELSSSKRSGMTENSNQRSFRGPSRYHSCRRDLSGQEVDFVNNGGYFLVGNSLTRCHPVPTMRASRPETDHLLEVGHTQNCALSFLASRCPYCSLLVTKPFWDPRGLLSRMEECGRFYARRSSLFS
jgi:hypothetical protein